MAKIVPVREHFSAQPDRHRPIQAPAGPKPGWTTYRGISCTVRAAFGEKGKKIRYLPPLVSVFRN